MPNHEQPPYGFGQEQQGQVDLSMPSRTKAATSLSSFTLEALQSYLNVAGKIKRDSVVQQLTTITMRNAAGYVVMVAITELLDTTLADTLSAFGDTHAETAIKALKEQKKAVTEEGKRLARSVAATSLYTAHGEYEKAIAKREGRKVFDIAAVDAVLGKEPKSRIHEKASGTAFMMATVYQDIDEPGLATDWANNAKFHFERYVTLKGESDRGTIADLSSLEFKLSNLQSSSNPFVIRSGGVAGPQSTYIGSRKAEIRDVKKSIAKLQPARDRLFQLDQEQQQFNQLHARLIAPK